MKIVKVLYRGKVNWGVLKEERVSFFKSGPFENMKLCKSKVLFNSCKLLAPASPEKIVCVGLNYLDHAKELKMKIPKEPVIFLKPVTSLAAPGQAIIYPSGVGQLDYEAELALVIRKKAKNIKVKDANKYVLGYTCLNDVTARDLQIKDGQWGRAKSFDTFCPLGPWLETDLNPENLKIQSFLNGKLMQSSTTKKFIFSVNQIVAFISQIMTLLPGDIISTGTPAGVGRMRRGDRIEVGIEKIGRLQNCII